MPEAIIGHLDVVRSCAAKVCARFSTDGWYALRDLSKTAGLLAAFADPQAPPGALPRRRAAICRRPWSGSRELAEWRSVAPGAP